MTARAAIIVMPVGPMEGVAVSRKECAPRHTGQIIDTIYRVSLIRHVNGGSLMVGEEFTGRRASPFSAARTA